MGGKSTPLSVNTTVLKYYVPRKSSTFINLLKGKIVRFGQK